MTVVGFQQPNDCVLVATATYLGWSYAEASNVFGPIGRHGIRTIVSRNAFIQAGLKRVPVPHWRKHGRVSGLVTLAKGRSMRIHMVVMIDGIVFDRYEPNGVHLSRYKANYNHNRIVEIWQ